MVWATKVFLKNTSNTELRYAAKADAEQSMFGKGLRRN
jgi:hypothetical protein